MSDVRKALKAAAGAVCEERNHPDYPCGRGDIDDNMARVAVLAFLRAMPDWESVTGPATDPIETPKYYRMALLIDDIEQEAQG